MREVREKMDSAAYSEIRSTVNSAVDSAVDSVVYSIGGSEVESAGDSEGCLAVDSPVLQAIKEIIRGGSYA